MRRIESELTALFLEWATSKPLARQRWRGEFGKELRRVLREWGNWKNAPRGNPKFLKRGKKEG